MREIHDLLFEKATEGMTAEEVLNYYRNLYHGEPQSTEHGIVANALNDILPRMIVPPCKVGDTVYMISPGGKIHENLVIGISVLGGGPQRLGFLCPHALVFSEDHIGETVFLAREEAERALKEKE